MQIVYYFFGYFRWLDDGKTRSYGDEVNFVVPTGNFGNSLAGFYAREMGLPIRRLVVATNSNDILHRFLSTFDYTARPVVPSLGTLREDLKAFCSEREGRANLSRFHCLVTPTETDPGIFRIFPD